MADYFTHFSCVLDAGTPEKAVQALDLHTRFCEEDEASGDSEFSGFALALQDGPGTSVLWFHDDGQGDVEAVIAFVLRLAPEIDLTGLWGFDYAQTCSRPRLEAFGGGAHVIDLGARKSIGWISTHEWLTAAMNGEDTNAVEALVQ
ncbi:MAG: hypothetical protein MUE84_13510 [Hyphomonas sp.]|nr:hypothetical protein [Hyphomonas sp.]